MRDRAAKVIMPTADDYIALYARPACRDRLAVWAYVEHGEEVPCRDPSVTDAERTAAGRETLAERWLLAPP